MSKPPNVVLCLCDQLRAFTVGCYGNPVIHTPNIDRLAEGGVRFDLAVTNDPVCVPARSSLLTGQYARTCTGAVGNAADDFPAEERLRLRDTTLPECFKSLGYKAAVIGKWHIHPHPLLVGFDDALYPLINERLYGQTYFRNWGSGFVVNEFGPDFEIKAAQSFILEAMGEPFFLFYSITPPHMPMGPGNAPEKYMTMYDRTQVPLRGNVWKDGTMASDEFWFKVYTIWDYWARNWPERREDREGDKLADGFDLRDLTAYYYGMVTCVDDRVGKLMETLAANGLAENTLVVFVSDHGDNLGSHHLFNKDVLYEESIRIPMIFYYPDKLRPHVNRHNIAQIIDVVPTVLDLCQVDIPSSVQGRSLVTLLRGEQDALEDNVAFIETDTHQIGIRTPTHLYGMRPDEYKRTLPVDRLFSADLWSDLFFDLEADPYQENNLAGSGEQLEVEQELRARLLSWNALTPWLEL